MKASEVMKSGGVFLFMEQTIAEASNLLIEKGLGAAPVLNKNKQLIGIISKDILLKALLTGLSRETSVEELMHTNYRKLGYNEEVVVNQEDNTNLIVVEKDGTVVGIIELADLFKITAQQIEEEKAGLRASLDAVDTPILAIDNYGRIIIFNQQMAKALKLDADKVIYQLAKDVLEFDEIVKLLTEEIIFPDSKITLNGTSYIPFRKDVIKDQERTGRVLVLRDMSEVEFLVRESEYTKRLNRELEAIFECSFDGLYVTDGQANTLRLNKGFERIMGISEEQCLGRNMRELVEKGVFSRSGTLIALEKGERVTLSLVSSNGKEALVTSNPIYDNEGNPIMVVTNVRDMTELNELQRKLERIEGLHELYKNELQQMKLENSRSLVMTSAKMKELVNMVIRVAAVDSTVLIQGESGVGKDLLAEIIHSNSSRKEGPFIRVNCGAIPENLLESELFGYEAGAFTGASRTGKIGLFELAQGGVLFLDEIGELPLNLQVKLLRVLQDREIIRVGGVQPIKVNCRIIAGTNRNLLEMIDKGQFRLDLYYRLNVIPIFVPPLRERREDIPVLVNYFLNVFNQKYGMKKQLDNKALNCLMEYNWPGNVRELENLIERLVVTNISDIIGREDLPPNIESVRTDVATGEKLIPLRKAVENTERELLKTAFARYNSSYQVARVLEVNQSTVVRKAQKYGIKR